MNKLKISRKELLEKLQDAGYTLNNDNEIQEEFNQGMNFYTYHRGYVGHNVEAYLSFKELV